MDTACSVRWILIHFLYYYFQLTQPPGPGAQQEYEHTGVTVELLDGCLPVFEGDLGGARGGGLEIHTTNINIL